MESSPLKTRDIFYLKLGKEEKLRKIEKKEREIKNEKENRVWMQLCKICTNVRVMTYCRLFW